MQSKNEINQAIFIGDCYGATFCVEKSIKERADDTTYSPYFLSFSYHGWSLLIFWLNSTLVDDKSEHDSEIQHI